jgi:hypothetical protein
MDDGRKSRIVSIELRARMMQQWLTLLGLGLDFTGFALLLREWWLAFFNEGRQIEMEEQLQHMQSLRNLRPAPQAGADPFANLNRMQDERAIRQARAAHRAAMSARRVTFLVASVLIVAGFLLQIAGAWPV